MSFSKLIDMNAVQTFLVVAEEGSMSAAATRLGLSQSGVSQAVRLLEEKLGVVLINRNTRPMTLTPFGLALKNRGAVLSEAIHNLKAQVVEAGKGIKPDLRVGLVDSFASTCGSAFAKQLLGKVSQLSVRTGLSPQQGERLLSRDLDLIISSDPLTDSNNILRYKIFSEKYFVITPKERRVSPKDIQDIRLLANILPVVRFNRHSQVGMQIDRQLRALEVRISNRLELDTADALTSMVAEGIGWAVTTPMCFLQAAAVAKDVDAYFIPELNLERSLYLICRQNEYESLFNDACAIARNVINSSLLPRIRTLGEGIENMITVNKE
ncbi:LysR family transcriptional regulator [Enterobacter hormaechei]|uniref:LysR family transcriptional regulator n=1 Tax=Enterobacter hormaechei TaxID=158836 RepID=UPI002614F220|nr:LysR family transcriptional regulator [Enterobacter hormaechei]MDN4569133.1 LysR family transcriptional regulator [Enterobacter hormaechei]MDN4997154.1 LysR family transcriptional regulator [Enterobacter hormaechei]MED5632835.1 LysR family transcriptional regulator [Enterobacter hormaechei]